MARPPKSINQDLFTRGGIITERDPDFCIVRLRMPAGMITPAQMREVGRLPDGMALNDSTSPPARH